MSTSTVTPTGTDRRSRLISGGGSRIETVQPRQPGVNEILIRVLLNGLCASDLPTWRHGPLTGDAVVLGHEPVGKVIAVGAGVDHLAVGDHVTGRLEHSFADHILARAEDAVVVPAGLAPEDAIGEPLGCIVEALRRSRVDVGDRVVVVGVGFMGLCLLQLLAASGVSEVIAVDTRAESLAQAAQHGATETYTPEQALGPGGLSDVVFEVTGVQAGLDLATKLVRPHGTLSIVGYHQAQRQVDMQSWNWKAIDVINGHVRDPRRLNDSIRRGLDLVASRRIAYPSLFTHRYSLDDIDQAFADLRDKPAGFIKAVIGLADQGLADLDDKALSNGH